MSKQFQPHKQPVVAGLVPTMLNGALMRRIAKLTGLIHGEITIIKTEGVPLIRVSMPLRAMSHFFEALGVVYVNDMLGTLNAPGECAVIQIPYQATEEIDLMLPANKAAGDSMQPLMISLFDQIAIDGVLLGTGDVFLSAGVSLGTDNGSEVEETEGMRAARETLERQREESLAEASQTQTQLEPEQLKENETEVGQPSAIEPSTDLQAATETPVEIPPTGAATGDDDLKETKINVGEITNEGLTEKLPQEAESVLSAEAGHDASESTATLKEEV